MEKEQTWVIETTDLEIGSSLSFDLTDSEGNVLHKAGMPITDRLIERLQRKNIHSMVVKGAPVSDSDSPSQILLDAFPSEVIQAISQSIGNIEKSLADAILAVQNDDEVDLDSVSVDIESFSGELETNNAAALAVLASKLSRLGEDRTKSRVARSTLLGLFGVSTSLAMHVDLEDAIATGVAGMLHDCSLLIHPEWFDADGRVNQDPKSIAQYRNHPLESMELLAKSDSASELILATVAQVHEQFDGSGYPNGLRWDEVGLSARILNLLDAYLGVVQPFSVQERRIEADALAYLCHHAAKQRFDPLVLRSLISSLSVYPIGSMVELDDATLAVVLESRNERPLAPKVRTLGKTGKTIDLSVSKRTIVGPTRQRDSDANRITKSMMESLLWRSDLAMTE